MTVSGNYVELLTWIPKDENGCATNALKGGISGQKQPGKLGRCGHSALRISHDNTERYYSFWPGGAHTYQKDVTAEKGLPDTIVRLHNLDIPAMLKAANEITTAKVTWEAQVASDEDVTQSALRANCATFAWSLLKVGGFGDPKTVYGKNKALKGPSEDFYKITKCHAGEINNGKHNDKEWRHWYFSPKTLLHLVASAAEKVEKDKAETTKIMNSDRVAVTKFCGPSSFGEKVKYAVYAVSIFTMGYFASLMRKKHSPQGNR